MNKASCFVRSIVTPPAVKLSAIGTCYSAYNTPRSNVAVILVTVPCIPYVPAIAFPLALSSLSILYHVDNPPSSYKVVTKK